MKKILLSTLLFASLNSNAQDVSIPDANFKALLVGNAMINTNSDTEIQVTEAIAYSGTIDCSGQSVSDLTGIEAFINIDRLWCYNNQLTSLDVSSNVNLTNLQCHQNQITSLDLSSNPALIYMYCYDNQIGSINLNNTSALISLRCGDNAITSLNLSNSTVLEYLQCYDNQLTSLDLSQNTALDYVHCAENQLTSLDISQNVLLENLICFDNSLTTLSLNNNTALTDLNCQNNQLTTLDLSSNTALTYIQCSTNQFTSLDFSQNISLDEVICQGISQLTSIDLSQNTNLTSLACNSSSLSSLDLSNATSLTTLYCNDNQLTSLDAKNGNNTMFNVFNASNNPDLICIQVDDAAWSTTNWTNIDATASFSENCCSIDNSISNVGFTDVELQAGEAGATYQWIDCDNSNQAIVGETTQWYAPSVNGNYACIIDNGSCSDTTDCFAVTTLGLEEVLNSQINLIPNPASTVITVQSDIKIDQHVIRNISGQIIMESTDKIIDVSSFKSGVYFITIITEKGNTTKRFVKS